MIQTTGRDGRRMIGIVIRPSVTDVLTTETITAAMLGSTSEDTMAETGEEEISSRSMKEGAMTGIS